MLKVSDFDFDLPTDLIAQEPNKSKEQTKMLVFDDNCQMLDKQVIDLLNYISEGDVAVFNDAKVIKAKLRAKIKRNHSILDFNLDQQIKKERNSIIWQALCRPAKKVNEGDVLEIADDFQAQVKKKMDNGLIILHFSYETKDFFEKIDKYGSIPLPPYIKRDEQLESDLASYQTIYANNGVAVAAPTAGLHFSPNLMEKIKQKKAKIAFVTLNVGAGTFLPVKSDLIQDHTMHTESFSISQETADIINNAKKSGNKIIAIGTTSLRVLESVVDKNGSVRECVSDTKIFIYPPYDFKIVDILMTNFHLPKSTLFMLICAFIGTNQSHQLYKYAIEKKYRFYSYGDSTLLIRKAI